jgi:HEAT repeat protein
MKKILLSGAAILLFTTLSFSQALDSQRTVRTRISDLLALMPAQNEAEIKNNAAQIALLGKDGLVEMIARNSGRGRSRTGLIEYAVGGFSYYVMQPGQENLRVMAVQAYCEALEKFSDAAGKSLMIRQLEITGNDESVACLQKYLSDDSLCDPAARALIKINTDNASEALLEALKKSTGRCRLSLIQAVGDTRYKKAVKALLVFSTDADKDTRKLILYALANIADPSSLKLLGEVARKAGYKYEQTNAAASYLLFAERLLQSPSRQIGLDIAKTLLKNAGGTAKIAALKLLVDALGEKSIPMLVEGMDSKDPEYRSAALRYAMAFNTPAATARWLKKLSGSSEEIKVGIVTMLGHAKAESALPAITRLLQSSNEELRSAAINSVQLIAEDKALDNLLQVMRTGNDKDVLKVKNAISSMKGDKVTDRIAAAFPSMPSNGKAAITELLGARSATNYASLILSQTTNDDSQIKTAALSSLKYVVLKENLADLFSLMDQITDPFQLAEVQEAIKASLKDIKDQERQSAIILDRMAEVPPDKQQDFFTILASVGGVRDLRPVSEAFERGDTWMRQAALSALTNWSDASAAHTLLDISLKYSGSYDTVALPAYIYSVRTSGFGDIQKYLMLREGMQAARTILQKRRVLQEISRLDCFPALLYAGKYLDTAGLSATAADAVVNMCLKDKRLYGNLVRDLLTRIILTPRGPESEYQKTAIHKRLNEMPGDDGLVSLFNGKDLSGWEGLAVTPAPVGKQKKNIKSIAADQKEAELIMAAGWQVHNGEMQFNGTGGTIFTVSGYSDFELFADYKVSKQDEKDALWLSQLPNHVSGEWNNLHIIRIGGSVSVCLNGKSVVDHVAIKDYENLHLPVLIQENIGLQGQNVAIAVRDIYLRELAGSQPYVLSKEEQREGFQLLFDGTNLDQWIGNKGDYVIENGIIALHPENKGDGNLYTQKEFGDFDFRFDFKLTPGANNGVGIRAPLRGDAAYVGMEIQILDNDAEIYNDLHEYQYHGSVYGVIPAKRGFLKPTGEWNSQRIIAKGNRITVILNGETILDGDIAEASKNGTLDKREHPGLKNKTGHIGFLWHETPVQFRRIRVKEL